MLYAVRPRGASSPIKKSVLPDGIRYASPATLGATGITMTEKKKTTLIQPPPIGEGEDESNVVVFALARVIPLFGRYPLNSVENFEALKTALEDLQRQHATALPFVGIFLDDVLRLLEDERARLPVSKPKAKPARKK